MSYRFEGKNLAANVRVFDTATKGKTTTVWADRSHAGVAYNKGETLEQRSRVSST